MSSYTFGKTVQMDFEQALKAVTEALAKEGFGVLTEIDLASTLNAKLDVDLPPQVILGACRPPLAYEAIQADPAIATVLPCNVVVRSTGDRTTVVEALDPWVMLGVGDDRALRAVADDARQRLVAALATVGGAS